MKTSILLANLEVIRKELSSEWGAVSSGYVNDAIKKINELELELYDLKEYNKALRDWFNGG